MLDRDVRAGVDVVDEGSRRLRELIVARGVVPVFVAFGDELAVVPRRHLHVLVRRWPVAVAGEHLAPGLLVADGTSHHLRGHRGDGPVRPRLPFAPETAPHEGIAKVDLGRIDVELLGVVARRVHNPLGRVVDRELVALPARGGRVRLHRVVVHHRREVGALHLVGRLREARREGRRASRSAGGYPSSRRSPCRDGPRTASPASPRRSSP